MAGREGMLSVVTFCNEVTSASNSFVCCGDSTRSGAEGEPSSHAGPVKSATPPVANCTGLYYVFGMSLFDPEEPPDVVLAVEDGLLTGLVENLGFTMPFLLAR